MPTRPEQLFESLDKPEAVRALIGQTEDLHLDCKVWPKEEDVQRIIAKTACGFANADGGVIVFGLVAKAGRDKDDPDEIQSAQPIDDTGRVKPLIQDLIGKLVEPGISGVRVAEVNDPAGSKSGFVTVLIPASDGPPHRSRKDSRFYQRISSGTYPMEYFQIADMFGKRHRPVLELHLWDCGIVGNISDKRRSFEIGIKNSGRAIAKYPGLRYRHRDVPQTVSLLSGHFGLPHRPPEIDWTIFGGGADHVIYPGETLLVARLHQPGFDDPIPKRRLVFPEWSISVQLSAEDTETKTVERTVREGALFT